MNKSRIIYIIFCLFLLLLIVFRYYSFQAEINQDREYGKFILSGKIITEPDVRDDNIKLTVKTDKGNALGYGTVDTICCQTKNLMLGWSQ